MCRVLHLQTSIIISRIKAFHASSHFKSYGLEYQAILNTMIQRCLIVRMKTVFYKDGVDEKNPLYNQVEINSTKK
jgi:hypothetical protein